MSKKSKIEVSKIELVIGGQKVELTIEQAKELQGLLNKTFPEKRVEKEYVPINRPQPIYPWRGWWERRIWCDDSAGDIPRGTIMYELQTTRPTLSSALVEQLKDA